jgi:hypothetical protein
VQSNLAQIIADWNICRASQYKYSPSSTYLISYWLKIPRLEGNRWVKDFLFWETFASYLYSNWISTLAMRKEPERMPGNNNESSARLQITSRTFLRVEVPLGRVFQGYSVFCGIPRGSKFWTLFPAKGNKFETQWTLDFQLVYGFTFLWPLTNLLVKLISKYSTMYLEVCVSEIIFNEEMIKN